jgi:hypothetical protein
LASKRLLDQVREHVLFLHYSFKKDNKYIYLFLFLLYRKGSMCHPKETGSAVVDAVLTMLANERQVPPSTHR